MARPVTSHTPHNVKRRERYRTDSEYREAVKAKSRSSYHSSGYRLHRLRKQGAKVTKELVDMLYAAQGGVCAICGATAAHAAHPDLHIDHCHASGEVRGLLCQKCNTALGLLGDSPAMLRRAILYLKRAEA
jgi:hypothetical protein